MDSPVAARARREVLENADARWGEFRIGIARMMQIVVVDGSERRENRPYSMSLRCGAVP